MKKVLAIILAIGVVGTAMADIHTPLNDRQTPVRKLSRALANIIYGALEIPATFERTIKEEGAEEAFSYGILQGFERTGVRIGYGLYELVNFRTPKYKDSFRAPYDGIDYDALNGYTEYPSSFGMSSASDYVSLQPYN